MPYATFTHTSPTSGYSNGIRLMLFMLSGPWQPVHLLVDVTHVPDRVASLESGFLGVRSRYPTVLTGSHHSFLRRFGSINIQEGFCQSALRRLSQRNRDEGRGECNCRYEVGGFFKSWAEGTTFYWG